MKKHLNVVAGCLMSIAAFAVPAHADTLANWTFETSLPTTSGPHTAEAGIFAGTSEASGVHISGSTVYSNPVGNGSNESFSSNFWAVDDYYQFTTSTTGYEDIMISWDQTGSNTGPRDFKLQYSTDGSAFTDFMSYQLINGNWSSGAPAIGTSYSADLSAIAALENVSIIYFRMTMETTVAISSANPVATSGTGRVDNIVISGTLIPAPGALAVFGLAGLLGRGRRRN